MASIEVRSHKNRLKITSQAFCCDIHDTWTNRKVLFVLLRAMTSPKTGKPLFSYQKLADAFCYKARQNINNYVREYETCGEDFFDYLRHKCKVDPQVVSAVREELRLNVLIKPKSLCRRVNERLGRDDLNGANIRVALEQIPCSVIRTPVLREIEQGRFHPKEEHVLAELCAMLEQSPSPSSQSVSAQCSRPPLLEPSVHSSEHDTNQAQAQDRPIPLASSARAGSRDAAQAETGLRYAEIVAASGLQAIHDRPDETIIQKAQSNAVSLLLNPHVPVSSIPEPIVTMVSAMSLYVAGISLSQLGRWFGGKAKSTIYNWVMGLALALWPVIQGWLRTRIKATKLYLDEKWLKIKKRWRYWFVAVDVETELPVFHDVLPTRTKWACRVFLLKLKRWGQHPSRIITDGLQGYESAIIWVYPSAKHLLCLFHHQQGVTRYVKKHLLKPVREEDAFKTDHETKDTKDANEAKRLMKAVTQTTDPRTVTRRLEQLEHTAERRGWNLKTWLKQTRRNLSKLLPSLRKNTSPTTTNGIERFFRAFTRFYKNRGGFHSVLSTTRALKLFLVVYLFTIQPESGHAPIEKIVPEANMMPFYQILNYPLTSMTAIRPSLRPPDVKPGENLATKPLKEAA